MTQAEFRSHFEAAKNRLYFNHAAYSPMSRPVADAMQVYQEKRVAGDADCWPYAIENLEALRKNFAGLVGTQTERIAVVANTVVGINVLATGLDWKPGDRVLIYENEFPANVLPFTNLASKGVEVDFISDVNGRLGPEHLEAALTEHTRVLAISSVQWLTGFRADLKALSEICHSRGILLSVDGIQSVGAFPMDIEEFGIDFLAAGGHKWLMCPMGTGLMYVTEELQERLAVGQMGYWGKVDVEDFLNFEQPLSTKARRFETGCIPSPTIVGARAATDLLLAAGTEVISKHIGGLLKLFRDGIKNLPFGCKYDFTETEEAGILIFGHDDPKRNSQINEQLISHGVDISPRGGWLRLAPHYYNNADDVRNLIGILSSIA